MMTIMVVRAVGWPRRIISGGLYGPFKKTWRRQFEISVEPSAQFLVLPKCMRRELLRMSSWARQGKRSRTVKKRIYVGRNRRNDSHTMKRLHQALLIGAFLPLCWLAMMAVHELGHAVG